MARPGALIGTRAAVRPVLLAALLLAAPAVTAQTAPVRVYGLELESGRARDRVLVFADGALEPRLEAFDERTLVLVLPGAVLDRSAPTGVTPRVAGPVSRVALFEPADRTEPEVRVTIERMPGVEPELSQRGTIVALDFPHPADPAASRFALHFENAELADVVEAIAEATGERFLFDETLRGRITIGVFDRLGSDETLEILHAALLVKGFAALPTPGGAWRILPVDAAAGSAPWVPEPLRDGRETAVTTLVRLREADPSAVVATLRPWLGAGGVAVALPGTRSVVLAGSESQLQSWIALAQALDDATDTDLLVRRLRHRAAGEAAGALRALFTEPGARAAPLEVWEDVRSNAIVVRAAPIRLGPVRAWLARFDAPVEGDGRLRAYAIRHVDPEPLAAQVREAVSGAAGPAALADEAGAAAGVPFTVAVHAPTRTLLVQGDAQTQQRVAALLRDLDREPPRVTVEALLLEIASSDSLQLGLDAFLPLTTPRSPGDTIGALFSNPSGGGLLQPGAGQNVALAGRITREPLAIPIVGPGGVPLTILVPRESAVVTADDRAIRTRVLMRPHLTVASGEEQELFAGDDLPIPVASEVAPALGPLATASRIERQDVGIRLRVRPSVGQAGDAVVRLELEHRRLAPSLAGRVAQVGPTLEERRLATTIRLADGQVAVVAMAPRRELRARERGTPYWKAIPVLGALLRTTRREVVRSQLVIAVQARIHRSREAELADSIRRRLAFERQNARAPVLRDGAPTWGVRVATTDSRAKADALAALVAEDAGRRPIVASWRAPAGARFDVVVTSLESVVEAVRVADRLRAAGWTAEPVIGLPTTATPPGAAARAIR